MVPIAKNLPPGFENVALKCEACGTFHNPATGAELPKLEGPHVDATFEPIISRAATGVEQSRGHKPGPLQIFLGLVVLAIAAYLLLTLR